jgi:hypothetical protein
VTIEHIFVRLVHGLVYLILTFIAVEEVAIRSIWALLLLEEVRTVLGSAIGSTHQSIVADEVIECLRSKPDCTRIASAASTSLENVM